MIKKFRIIQGWFLALLLKKRKQIDFAIIGFPKCGTTSLHKSLIQSASIDMPDFEVQISNFIKEDIGCHSSGNLFGIKNPNLIYEPHNLQALYYANKNIKIIIGLRDPKEWLYSFFQYRKLEIRNNVSWLRKKKYKKDIQNVSELDFKCFVDNRIDIVGASVENGIYVNYINDILNIFHHENVFVYLLEDIANNPDIIYPKLYSFLGLECDNYPSPKKANCNSEKYEQKKQYVQIFQKLEEYYLPYNDKLNLMLKDIWNIRNTYW